LAARELLPVAQADEGFLEPLPVVGADDDVHVVRHALVAVASEREFIGHREGDTETTETPGEVLGREVHRGASREEVAGPPEDVSHGYAGARLRPLRPRDLGPDGGAPARHVLASLRCCTTRTDRPVPPSGAACRAATTDTIESRHQARHAALLQRTRSSPAIRRGMPRRYNGHDRVPPSGAACRAATTDTIESRHQARHAAPLQRTRSRCASPDRSPTGGKAMG